MYSPFIEVSFEEFGDYTWPPNGHDKACKRPLHEYTAGTFFSNSLAKSIADSGFVTYDILLYKV